MKIIDKTPYQNAQGEIELAGRVQGTLRFGFTWIAELRAQKAVIAQLDRLIEKGHVLIRNFTLPNSEIVIPLILIGSGGVWVIQVTTVKGFFEAKGDQWNTVSNGRSQPANINLLNHVAQLARALQFYFNRQKIQIPAPIEPVLIATDPGAHIELLRPIARVVMSDAIKQFAASVIQARPVLRSDVVFDMPDRILNLRPPDEPPPQTPQPVQTPDNAPQTPSRAKAIFNASEQVQPFNPSDLKFAFEEGDAEGSQVVPENLRETSPAQPLPKQPAAKKGKILGMTTMQLVLLVGMLIVECCILIGFGVFIYLSQ